MTHKIAIITSREVSAGYDDYGDNINVKIADSITDWDEVSDEDFNWLQKASYTMGFRIIERPVDSSIFIPKTIADYKAIIREQEEKLAKEKAAREEAALARKMKKALKDKDAKLKMLKKLQEELGDEALTVLAKPV